jgi:uncharacterized protein YdaU (DUF1376 family)
MTYRDRQWMPFYVEDFKMDTFDLECDELGVYFMMIVLAWVRGDGSVSGDMAELKKQLQSWFREKSFHGHTFNRIVPKLLRRYFYRRDDGRYYQSRVEKELQIARKLSAKRSQIANKRWAKYNQNKHIANPNADPNAMHTHTQTHNKSVYVSTQSIAAGSRSGSNGPRAPAAGNATIGERMGDWVWDGTHWAEYREPEEPFG